eukprot:scaffold127187_cov29-Tisochrysis_lutea.AAC.7
MPLPWGNAIVVATTSWPPRARHRATRHHAAWMILALSAARALGLHSNIREASIASAPCPARKGTARRHEPTRHRN